MKSFVIVMLGVFAGISLWHLAKHFAPVSISNVPTVYLSNERVIDVSYVDMVSLMLTGVTVILASLGFVVAVLAFVGWKSIQAIAATSAREVVRDAMTDGGKLDTLLKKEVEIQLRYRGVEEVDTDFEEPNGVRSENGS